MSKSILITAALLSGLQWMIEDAVEVSYERVANGGMEPEDRLQEVQEIDMAIDFLAEAGADDAIITRLRGAYVDQSVRDEIEAELSAKEAAARAARPKVELVAKPHIFTTAAEALSAGAVFDVGSEACHEFKVTPVYEGHDRTLAGFQIKVYDADGFALRGPNFLAPVQ